MSLKVDVPGGFRCQWQLAALLHSNGLEAQSVADPRAWPRDPIPLFQDHQMPLRDTSSSRCERLNSNEAIPLTKNAN